MSEWSSSTRLRDCPGVQFVGVGVDAAALFMKLAVDWKFLGVFPSANGSLAAHQIGRNFFPGIQPDAGFPLTAAISERSG